MSDHKPKGHVEFSQSRVKLVADMPGDEELRENLDEMIHSDGYPGSCAVFNSQKKDDK
ncbi:hypothetical protein [Paenibacillus abyssi]|uniref:Uncharacterized protein n=1 Tax=Paenibacillus abyssi TaxID=1340531 RepID=A0A917FYB2_9BACL|nr:hypothetical protein [Paenibacillus abyssi]GGG14006.1 hypothetical protein GCM10010916_33630 [Paenibacillus abyssi]